MQIIGAESDYNVLVEFQDAHKVMVHTTYQAFKKGSVKNPYDKSVFGVGCLGQGPYKSREGKLNTMHYSVWMAMLQRCYAEKYRNKYPAYYGVCSVCEEWLNFQNFANWYDANFYDVEGRLHLDKDILCPGNKEYAPERCILVPQRINMLFHSYPRIHDADLPTGIRRVTGGGREQYASRYNTKELGVFPTIKEAYDAYAKEKEHYVAQITNEYKGVLPEKVYRALIAYKCPDYVERRWSCGTEADGRMAL